MEFRQLKYFIGVAEELHYGNAAKKLFVSQSALSQQIQLLENEIGTPLFEKSKRNYQHKVVLTEAGAAFLKDAYQILQLAQQSLLTAKRATIPNLRLGYFQLAPLSRVLDIQRLFRRDLPHTHVQLVGMATPVAVEEALFNESIDIGIVLLPVRTRNLVTHTVACAPPQLLLNVAHPLAEQPKAPIRFIENAPWIDLERALHPMYNLVEAVFKANGVSRKSVQEVSSFEWIYALVGEGLGMGIVPKGVVEHTDPRVVELPLVSNEGLPLRELDACIALAHRKDFKDDDILALLEKLTDSVV
jgi:DNA-binding transcriptional LysR family regulator